MKHWFRNQGRKKKVQFNHSGRDFGETDRHPPYRSVTPDLAFDRGSLYASMTTSGQSTPRGLLSKVVRSRTPDGSLTSYYLDDEPQTSSHKSASLPRQPFHAEPRFTSENVDSNIRGRNHGYYIKAAGIGEQNGNKENLKLIYDRSRMASPVTSSHNSQYTSKVSSNIGSRTGSFRNKGGHRRYLPKKRPAPRPPASGMNGETVMHRPHNSLDSRTANGEVAMKVFRKKRKAPQPPTPVQRSWVDEQISKSPSHSFVVHADVYPIEPPVDYNKKVEESSEEEDDVDDEPMNETAIENNVEETSPKADEVEMETTPPVSDVSIIPFIPEPPPPPAALPIVNDSPKVPETGSPTAQTNSIQVDDTPSSPKEKLPRMGSLLRKDIVKAAMERADKGFVEPKIEYKSAHQIFAAELQEKVKLRDERMNKGALKVRALSSSRMFKARPSLTPTETPKTPLDGMIERAQEQAKLREDMDNEKRKIRGSARVMTKEWLPEHDLDDVFNEEVRHPTSHLTARSGNYYDISNPGETDLQASQVLYRKNQYAKASRKKSGNLEKLRRSIGKAFGSIGKGLHRKTAEIQEMYSKEDGWEIIFKEECDPPPTEMIKIKRMEKHPAYAYHAEKEQLILLPDFDRIIVTQDGRRIRETEMSKSAKQPQNKSLPSFTRKERPSLDGIFQSAALSQTTHSERTAEERKQITMMEDQFAQVRKINKTHTKNLELSKQWKSTPDLVKGVQEEPFDAGVFSDSDLPLRTSSMKAQDREKGRSLEKLSLSKKKKKSKSKKSSSSSEGKSPRQKVLQKGMDYYLRSRPTTPNPVYSSDEENDEAYDEVPTNSDQTSSDSSSKPKSESLGDSGIGQESLNSSASTASGAPLAAQVHQDALQQSMNASQGPMYYTSMPNPVFLAPVPTPVMLTNSMNSPTGHPSPMMYQTMYYPSNSLPHGAHMISPNIGEAQYHTLPANTSAAKHNESGITNSDSNSTLVASNNSTLEHKSTVMVTNNLPAEGLKSTSKVMNVTPNIAVVSYSNTTEREPQDISVAPKEENEFQKQLKKQYVMGPIGFRPVKFDPSVKTTPVSLPEKTQSIRTENSDNVGDSGDAAHQVTADKPEESSTPREATESESEDDTTSQNTPERAGTPQLEDTGDITPTIDPKEEDKLNNNQKR